MQPIRVGSGVEQRKHKRVPLGVPIECRSGQMTVAGRAENISVSGLLIRAEKTFAEDEEITVSFQLPGSTQAIQFRASVAHVVPEVFIGVEFLDIPAELSELIEKYVAAGLASAVKQK